MRRSLFYSLILHILILIISFFYIQDIKKETPTPFFARIITPEELEPPPPSPLSGRRQKMEERKTTRMPKLPDDLQAPKKLSAIPKQTMPGRDKQTLPQQLPPAEKYQSGAPRLQWNRVLRFHARANGCSQRRDAARVRVRWRQRCGGRPG